MWNSQMFIGFCQIRFITKSYDIDFIIGVGLTLFCAIDQMTKILQIEQLRQK